MTRIKILYQKIKQQSKGKFDDQNIPLVTKVWTQYWDIDIISIVMFEPKVLAIDKMISLFEQSQLDYYCPQRLLTSLD